MSLIIFKDRSKLETWQIEGRSKWRHAKGRDSLCVAKVGRKTKRRREQIPQREYK